MSEFIHEWDMCGDTMSLLIIHRLISKGYEVSGTRESELTIVSHPLQKDFIRASFGWLGGVAQTDKKFLLDLIQDAEVNPFRRVKAWLTDKDLSPSEVYVETPKGRCRFYNLSTICL